MTAKIQPKTYTVTLDTQKATMRGYQNWLTFRLMEHATGTFLIQRLTNRGGNGQSWAYCGWVDSGELLASYADSGLEVACLTVLARHFGLAYAQETALTFPNARVFRPTGKATAAPTLLQRGHRKGRDKGKTRNKNRNMAREKAHAIDLGAAMRAREG
tara:strand:- start:4466 stop:4939 length:474 start_codon:yes stop_codon:yes gene_type:complete